MFWTCNDQRANQWYITGSKYTSLHAIYAGSYQRPLLIYTLTHPSSVYIVQEYECTYAMQHSAANSYAS